MFEKVTDLQPELLKHTNIQTEKSSLCLQRESKEKIKFNRWKILRPPSCISISKSLFFAQNIGRRVFKWSEQANLQMFATAIYY